MTKQKYSRWSILILVGLLCLQACFLVYFGGLKKGFNEDEMATYTLSNYPEGFFNRTESLLNNWVDGDVLYDVLIVSNEEKFDYKMVYANQESDVHPPLYYFIVHTISSLFPGQFSKWIGLVPNIVLCLLSSAIMFFLSRELLKNDFLAMIVVEGWAFSVGAVDIATFLRMYAMLTLWTTLFVFLHVKALNRTMAGQRISACILVILFLCTFLGLMTQYYFSVFALFLCGTFFLYLLFSKKWRDLWIYVLVEFGAIIAALVYYPAMIRHIFGSGYRGQEAFRNLKKSESSIAALEEVLQIVSNDMFNGWAKELIYLCIALLAIALLRKFLHVSIKKVDGNLEISISRVSLKENTGVIYIPEESLVIADIGIVLLLYCVLISKVAPYREDRYYMCLYPLFVLCAVYIVYRACSYAFKKPAISKVIAVLLVCVITVFGLVKQEPGYLYSSSAARADVLEEYSDKPVIVLNNAYNWYATKWLAEYGNYQDVYICEYGSGISYLDDAAATNDLTDGFLLYVLRFSENDEEMLEKVQAHLPIEEYEKLCSGSSRVFYCTLED